MTTEFPIQIGEVLKKSQVHELVGGSSQHGMTSCQDGASFLLFHNEKIGKKFGYDVWEGWQADGTFTYTGQGASGDQSLTKSNRSLLKAADENKPIHLFHADVNKTDYEYIGVFALSEKKFDWKYAPGLDGVQRKVVVFHLSPLGSASSSAQLEKSKAINVVATDWKPSSTTQSAGTTKAQDQTQFELEEMKLHQRFAKFLMDRSIAYCGLEITFTGLKGTLRPDFYLPVESCVVEAKGTTSREHVRLAIGQVLDYTNLMKINGQIAKPAVLLPARPSPDLETLLAELDIRLITEIELGKFNF